ncbi:MAG TPA: DUF92 domain-containing protein [Thermoflexales bacterium]|nr:DUF92 domain-containing protein [Thermoflexales bacterium]HQX09750.1 DUF92 domain-containing protein [Thermoflexales bacterium]HQZ53398.1 DUF92 domain-containing protein [Thermoflexales bacterium]HRA53878.1 DUF92 domain-containing protein [Thermoflexales bacterium]
MAFARCAPPAPEMPPAILLRLCAGLALSAGIGWLAWRRQSLSRGGVLGAILIGTAMFGFGGLASGLSLIVFFVTSSLLSRLNEGRKRDLQEKYAKGSRRDFGQALANGGAAAGLAVAAALAHAAGDGQLTGVLLCAMLGALATSNGDTWATEIGALSRTRPRLITRPWRQVAPGTSGGVTGLGTAAALAGAMLIGLTFVGLRGLNLDPEGWQSAGSALTVIAAAEVGGLAGALFDSVLGATAQGIYRDPARDMLTEKACATDGQPYPLARGWRWMSNDWVNFLASLAGAGVAALIRLAAV